MQRDTGSRGMEAWERDWRIGLARFGIEMGMEGKKKGLPRNW